MDSIAEVHLTWDSPGHSFERSFPAALAVVPTDDDDTHVIVAWGNAQDFTAMMVCLLHWARDTPVAPGVSLLDLMQREIESVDTVTDQGEVDFVRHKSVGS
jgi:hypothetical protein